MEYIYINFWVMVLLIYDCFMKVYLGYRDCSRLQGLHYIYKIHVQIGFFGCRVTRIAVGYKCYYLEKKNSTGVYLGYRVTLVAAGFKGYTML